MSWRQPSARTTSSKEGPARASSGCRRGWWRASDRVALRRPSSEPRGLLDGALDVVNLRQDGVLESRRVADECVGRGNAAHRRVEPGEALVGYAGGDLRPVAPRDRVLVDDDDTARLLDRGVHGALAPRRQRAQVDHLDARALLGQLVRRGERTLDGGPVCHDGDVRAYSNVRWLDERDDEVRRRIRRLVVSLAVQVVVCEKYRWIVAPDRRSEESIGVQRGRRTDDAQ